MPFILFLISLLFLIFFSNFIVFPAFTDFSVFVVVFFWICGNIIDMFFTVFDNLYYFLWELFCYFSSFGVL